MAQYKLPSVEDLLEAGVHFGHQARRWHPKMEPYIFDQKKDIHILDLYQTEELLAKACEFLYETAAKGGQIVIVGTKKQAKEVVESEAKRSGAMFVSSRWIGGIITNYPVIKKNINKLKDFTRKREAGELSHYTKKERLLIDREIEKLQSSIGGIQNLSSKPDAIFVIDVKREKTAVRECARQHVPVVGLVDTNSDPTGIQYVVPGNDDAIRSVAIIVKAVADAIEAGYQEFARKGEEARVEAERAKEEALRPDDVEIKKVEETKEVVENKEEKKPTKKEAPKKAKAVSAKKKE